MVTVRHLLMDKGQEVYSTTPDATVYTALKLMADKGIGALVVQEGDQAVGMISERDYARKIILKGKFSKDTLVQEIMTSKIVYVSPDHTAEQCMTLMTDKLIRHMPVIENDRLVGLISIGDVVKWTISSQELSRAAINALLRHSLEDMSLDALLERALDLIFSIPWLGFEKQGCIFAVENASDTLVMKAESGLCETIKNACSVLPFGKCLCGRAAVTQKVVFADCIDERHDVSYDGLLPHGHYCIPIIYEGKTLGVINLYVREGHQHSQREEDFLTAVANTLAGIMMRKRLEQELVQSERLAAVGQTVAGLAHCIKSILFGMEGGVYIVDKGFKTGDLEKLETGWNMVHKNIDKVSSLVVDLLDYSKERTPQLELCSPNIIAEDVCELMEYKARDSSSVDIEFIKDFAPGLGDLLLDPKGIHRCLLNLVDNAIDACLSDETESKIHKITIKTRKMNKDTLLIQVSDTGCGMTEDVRRQVLTAFYTTKGSKGTGLGLLITQKIVREHGGTLSVASRPGEGSVFTILLPVKTQSLPNVISKAGLH